MADVERMFTEKKFTNLLQTTNRDLPNFNNFYESVKYLKGLENDHSEFLYKIYKPTLEISCIKARPLLNFTQENRDMLSSLKFRWLHDNL